MSFIANAIKAATDELLEIQIGEDPVAFVSSQIELTSAGITHFKDIESSDYAPKFDLITKYLNTGLALILKLSIGIKKDQANKDSGFTGAGTASLIRDITEVRANGESIHRICYELIKQFGESSTIARDVKIIYDTASALYAGLHREIPKLAVINGTLPTVNLLKPLSTPPS
jgi:hypothetical protein